MKATHTDYKHPKHLRVVEDDGTVLCYSPSCSTYAALNRKGLPSWPMEMGLKAAHHGAPPSLAA